VLAENGQQAIETMRSKPFDLVLLDIMMPGMNGYEVLEYLKADVELRHIPIIMISALDDVEGIVRCIELGAEDYLTKPFNPTLLKARLNASLEKKRLRDQEQAYFKQLQEEQERSERLLLNILPKTIADKLKQEHRIIADNFDNVTVMFADIVDFTSLSIQLQPKALVKFLNQIFSAFDELTERYQLEKIKTIGDSYMVVGGLPTPRPDHAEAIAEMALHLQPVLDQLPLKHILSKSSLKLRIGINTGSVGAGVIGTRKFTYDLWGDTVNTASRMESLGVPGQIQVAPTTYEHLKDKYKFEERGVIDVKGKGEMMTYFLVGRKA
jgi:adenylate cyclase